MKDTGKAAKHAAIYTIPWMVLSILLGWVLGLVFSSTGIASMIAVNQYGWLISGAISTFVVWLVWLRSGLPDEYLNKYTR